MSTPSPTPPTIIPNDLPNPLIEAQLQASTNASHHEIKFPGYHLYETRYDSPFILNHQLPPGSKLYSGPRHTNGTPTQVGFLVIPPAFHPHEVALSIEHSVAKQFQDTHQEQYAIANTNNVVRDFTGLFPNKRITPIQPLVALNVPTTVHAPSLYNPETSLLWTSIPLLCSTMFLAGTGYFTTRTLHKSFAQTIQTSTQSPQQFASRILSTLKQPLANAATTIGATMPLIEIVLTATTVTALLNRYRTKSIIDSEYKQSKDVERNLHLTSSIVSPLIITHSDPKYNIHPSALAFLGDIIYHSDLTNADEKDQYELQNQYVLSNANYQHAALCNVALDVPQPLPSSSNLLFDCFDPQGDLITAFTGERMNSERAESEFIKRAKSRQRENKILAQLPLFFSEIPTEAYKGFATLLGITYGVTKFSHTVQRLILNKILTKSTMVLRNLSFENQQASTSMRLPPAFMNQMIYNQQSSVLFPSLSKLKPFIAFRVFMTGLFTAYFYKIMDQGSILANSQQQQQFKPKCSVFHKQYTDDQIQDYYTKLTTNSGRHIDPEIEQIGDSYSPRTTQVEIDHLFNNQNELLELIMYSHQKASSDPNATAVITDPTQATMIHDQVSHQSGTRDKHEQDFHVSTTGNAAQNQGKVIPHLSIQSPEAIQYPSMIEGLIPTICTANNAKPSLTTKLFDEWLPATLTPEQLFERQKKSLEYLHSQARHSSKQYQLLQFYFNQHGERLEKLSDFEMTSKEIQQEKQQQQIDTIRNNENDEEKEKVPVLHLKATPNVITRSFWSFPQPPLPSALIEEPKHKSNFLLSSYAAMSNYFSKNIMKTNTSEKTIPNLDSTQEVMYQTASQQHEPYGTTMSSVLSTVFRIFQPLALSKPILPDNTSPLKSSPHALDTEEYGFGKQLLLHKKVRDYKDITDATVTLQDGTEILSADNINHKSKGNQTSLHYFVGTTAQTLFNLITYTTMISIPLYLTAYEYYHQRNLGYLTHSFGMPHISDVGTPGMLTPTQAVTKVNPWLLERGLKFNSKRIFSLYNSWISLQATWKQSTMIIKNALFSNLNDIQPLTPADKIAQSYGAQTNIFPEGNQTLLTKLKKYHRFIISSTKFAILYFTLGMLIHSFGTDAIEHIKQSTAPVFSDRRNGILTRELRLDNSSLVFYDKQSAHNIRLRQSLEAEKRKAIEKTQEQKDKEDVAKFGPQQAVKRLFDNALKRAKQQEEQEDVKKKEEEFEAKLDENGEIKLTRKQRLLRWWHYCRNVIDNTLFMETKSSEKKYLVTIHNFQSAALSNGTMFTLLQEYLRKELIKHLQTIYDKEEAERIELEKEFLAAEEEKVKLDPTYQPQTLPPHTPKKIEDDPKYPKAAEKLPNFKFSHVLQRSDVFMLLDQQNIHNEYEYIYHILHKRYMKELANKSQEQKGTNETTTPSTTTSTTTTDTSIPRVANSTEQLLTSAIPEPRVYNGIPLYVLTSPL